MDRDYCECSTAHCGTTGGKEMDIDKAVELARSADVDGFTVQEEKPFQYDAESWHLDMADAIWGDVEANDYIRKQLIGCLNNMPRKDSFPQSDRSKILTAQCLVMHMINIGGQILENAINNGLTVEKLGEIT